MTAQLALVKQGDLVPRIDTTVRDGAGVVINLTGVTAILFYMRQARNPTVVKINGSAGILVDGVTGKVAYQWAGTDTDTPGTYEAEYRITPASGGAFRVPTDGYIEVVVEPKVA